MSTDRYTSPLSERYASTSITTAAKSVTKGTNSASDTTLFSKNRTHRPTMAISPSSK